jgi:hypothetical protein
MAYSQVVDGGNGLQLQRLATNTMNKQPRTTDKGWSSSLEIGHAYTYFYLEGNKNHELSKVFFLPKKENHVGSWD